MIQLIYYSVANVSLSETDIYDILEVSRKNNSRNNITGCLLYYNDAFLQILEGDEKTIEELYAAIEADERHYNVRRVYADDIQERLFKDWSMDFYDLGKNDAGENVTSRFRKSFSDIANQTAQSTVAGELFWDIAHQLIND